MRSRRLSIAGLMTVVFVLAICLAALKSGSAFWAGGMFLLVASILTLAIVGAICRDRSERAWWLGFSLFGWGYLALAFLGRDSLFWDNSVLAFSEPVTLSLFRSIRFYTIGVVKQPPVDGPESVGILRYPHNVDRFGEVCHYMFSLFSAALGGGLAGFLFGGSKTDKRGDPASAESIPSSVDRRLSRRAIAITSVGLVCLPLLILVGFRSRIWHGSGLMLILTWGFLGLAVLGAACGHGPRRVSMFGAALFGIGYMALIFRPDPEMPNATYITVSHLINVTRPYLPQYIREFPSYSPTIDVANIRILETLERNIPLRFPEETPLEDFVKALRSAMQDSQNREIAIHVDPIGLQEAEKTMESPVIIDLEGVPLRTSLALALKPLGLTYGVRGGVLIINIIDADTDLPPIYKDPFLVIGHCFFALLAALLGSVLAPLVAGRQGRTG